MEYVYSKTICFHFRLFSGINLSNTKQKLLQVLRRKRVGMATFRLDQGQIEVVDDTMAEILRYKTPAERIRIGFTMWTSARNMLMTHLKKTHPDWDNRKVEKEVARRFSHGTV